MISEAAHIESLEKHCIPSKVNEFRSNWYYVVEPALRKYEFIKPNAKPIEEIKISGFLIFEWKDTTVLHTKNGWRKLRR